MYVSPPISMQSRERLSELGTTDSTTRRGCRRFGVVQRRMNTYFGYIRVSTAKQGTHGVSLAEQKAAIERYAARSGLSIGQWFEERETAAKRGRPVFGRMLGLLRNGDARGAIIHKIDRSARNLKDWADLGDLIDAGVEVHFAADALDLNSRGGRLSADIQAVVAADYIRNLRDEAKKGIYGRLKQGIYPFRAPLGYVDQGGGKCKTLDPKTAPLVRLAFELYATRSYSLEALGAALHARGLQRRNGDPLAPQALSDILNNPFYAGVIRIKPSRTTFKGLHEPLVSWSLFEHVGRVLRGKGVLRLVRHDFTFRKMISCGLCQNTLVGERQKGRVYYRCHTRDCMMTTIREDRLQAHIRALLTRIELRPEELDEARMYLEARREEGAVNAEETRRAAQLALDNARSRLDRLTDAYVDALLDKAVFEERRGRLVREIARLEEALRSEGTAQQEEEARLSRVLELAKNVVSGYDLADAGGQREILENVFSNCVASPKSVEIRLRNPFQALSERPFIG